MLHIRRTLPPLSFSRRRYALPPPCWRRTRESAPIATLRPPCAPLPLPPPPPHSPSALLLPFLPISRHRARVRVSLPPLTTTTTFSYLHTIGRPDVLLTGNVSFRVAAPFPFRGGATTHRVLHAGVAPMLSMRYQRLSLLPPRHPVPLPRPRPFHLPMVMGDRAYRAIHRDRGSIRPSIHRSSCIPIRIHVLVYVKKVTKEFWNFMFQVELDRVVGRKRVDGRRDRRGERRVKGEIGGSEKRKKPKEEEERR